MELTRLSELEDHSVPLARWRPPGGRERVQCARCGSDDVVAPLPPGLETLAEGLPVVCVACGVVHSVFFSATADNPAEPAGLLTRTALAALRRLLGRPRSTWWAP